MSIYEVKSIFGKGSQHKVGRLGEGKLIKWPYWKGQLWDNSTYETASRDLRTLKEWGVPVPEAEVVRDPVLENGSSIIEPPYAILIDEVRGRIFRELDLVDEGVSEQILEIVKKSVLIRQKTGSSLDFLGGEAIKQFIRYLFHERTSGQLGAYNVLIDQGERLKLIDTNLLDPARAPYGVGCLIDASTDLQHTLLAELLENRVLIDACLSGNKSKTVTKWTRKLYGISRAIEADRAMTLS